MPDFERVAACAALAKVLWFMPPPARAQVAVGLYDLGVRVHPELATKELVTQGPAGMGEHRKQRLTPIASRDDFMAMVRRFNPALADKIDAAQTDEQKRAVAAEIRLRHPEIIANAEQRLAATTPEDLG